MSNNSTENARLMEVKTAMLLHVPFFASLLLDMMTIKVGKFPSIFPPGNETAATDGKNIWFDEDFLNGLTLPEAVFATCHEVGHAMWQHMARGSTYKDVGFRGREFNPMLWNIAGDYVINDMLIKAEIGQCRPEWLHKPQEFTQEDLVDEVYAKLQKESDENGGIVSTQGQGGDEGQVLDHHIFKPAKESEQEWKRACQTAADAAKAMDKLPAALERFVEKLLNPKVPWQDKLRYHLTRAIGRDSHTWTRPHRRRLIQQGIVLPSYTGFNAGKVVVAIDTSGSIGQKELTIFLSELQEILDVSKPEQVWVMGIDAEVNEVTELSPGDSLVDNPPKLGGGGGTSFIPAFEWVKEQGIDPAALVYFTDMMGYFPNEEPEYPTLWCATTDHAAPWGEIVKIDIEEYDDE